MVYVLFVCYYSGYIEFLGNVGSLVRTRICTCILYILYLVVVTLHSIFRYQFFLQLKKDIRNGKLVIPHKTAVLLASYAVQCEFIHGKVQICSKGLLIWAYIM